MPTTETLEGSTIQSTQYNGNGVGTVSVEELEELLSESPDGVRPTQLFPSIGFLVEEPDPLQAGMPTEVMADIKALLRECCPEGLEEVAGKLRHRIMGRSPEDLIEAESELRQLVEELTCERRHAEHELDTCLWRKEDDSLVRDAMTQIVQLLNGMKKVLRAVQEQLSRNSAELVMASA